MGLSWKGRRSRFVVMPDSTSIVWILGAGFSVPLGGPLFRALISASTARELEGWGEFATLPIEGLQQTGLTPYVISKLYQSGTGAHSSAKLWADAEEFLDRLDVAASEPNSFLARAVKEDLLALKGRALEDAKERNRNPQAALMAIDHLASDLKAVRREAIRFVAGACTSFLQRAEDSIPVVDESEQWDPYRRWMDSLQPGKDTILTFNYDRALDLIGLYRRRKESGREILFSPAGQDSSTVDTFLNPVNPQRVPVYHLHGHVGWQRSSDGKSIVRDRRPGGAFDDRPLAHRNPEKAVIGTPGESKLALPGGLLKPLWDRAIEAIHRAGAVVFVGYRFPETDNLAKRAILDALRGNKNAAVHIVLGANNPDIHRLEGMIAWTRYRPGLKAKHIRVHQMYAQDFFAVFESQYLFSES